MPLQKVNLGTAPTGTDGDTVRVANVKANANVDVLNTQATLASSSPNAVRDLTAADMGKRVNFTPTAAGTVHFPKASDTGADQLVAVHNLATAYDITMAIAAGSGDTAPTIVVVKPGEMLTWETDGVSVWRTIGRKKAFDEVVQGKLTVAGSATVASLAIGATASISSTGAFSGASAGYTGNVTVGGTLSVTGQATFTVRPVFNSKTPWDSGNLDPASPPAWGATTPNSGRFTTVAAMSGITSGGAASGMSGSYLAYNSSGALTASMAVSLFGGDANSFGIHANSASGTLSLGVAGAEQLAILANGRMYTSGVRASTFPQACKLNILFNGSTEYGMQLQTQNNNTNAITFANASGIAVGSVTIAAAGTSFNTTSDYRVKTIVRSARDVLSRVCAVPVYRGYYTADGASTEHDLSLAHEIAKQFPIAISGEKDAVSIHPVYRDGYNPSDVKPDDVLDLVEAAVLQQADYSRLVIPLFAAVQELKGQLDKAIARIAILESAK